MSEKNNDFMTQFWKPIVGFTWVCIVSVAAWVFVGVYGKIETNTQNHKEEVTRINREFNEYRLHVSETYAKSTYVADVLKPINERFDRIESKLDALLSQRYGHPPVGQNRGIE